MGIKLEIIAKEVIISNRLHESRERARSSWIPVKNRVMRCYCTASPYWVKLEDLTSQVKLKGQDLEGTDVKSSAAVCPFNLLVFDLKQVAACS